MGGPEFIPPTPLTKDNLPVLKQGELAMDGNYLYLGKKNGEIQRYISEELFHLIKEEAIRMHIVFHH